MSKNYSGSCLTDFYKGKDQWSFYIPSITLSKYHSVLYELPVNSVPQPHIERNPKHWDDNHVRMPYSPENLYPVEVGNMCEVQKKFMKSFTDF